MHKAIAIRKYIATRNKISLKEFFELRDKLKVQSIGNKRTFPCILAEGRKFNIHADKNSFESYSYFRLPDIKLTFGYSTIKI